MNILSVSLSYLYSHYAIWNMMAETMSIFAYYNTRSPAYEIVRAHPPTCCPALTHESLHTELQRAWPSL